MKVESLKDVRENVTKILSLLFWYSILEAGFRSFLEGQIVRIGVLLIARELDEPNHNHHMSFFSTLNIMPQCEYTQPTQVDPL